MIYLGEFFTSQILSFNNPDPWDALWRHMFLWMPFPLFALTGAEYYAD